MKKIVLLSLGLFMASNCFAAGEELIEAVKNDDIFGVGIELQQEGISKEVLDAALNEAFFNGHSDMVEVLLAYAENSQLTLEKDSICWLLERAVEKGFSEIVQILLTYAEDKQLILDQDNVGNALIEASEKNFSEIIHILLKYVEDKNIILDHSTVVWVLVNVAGNGQVVMVNILLKYVENKKISLDKHDVGRVLANAAFNGHFETVKILLAYAKDKQFTPELDDALEYAVVNNHKNIVLYILGTQGKNLDFNALQKTLLSKNDVSQEMKKELENYRKVYPVLIGKQTVQDYKKENKSREDLVLLFSWAIMSDSTAVLKKLLEKEKRILTSDTLPDWLKNAITYNAKKTLLILLPEALEIWKEEAKKRNEKVKGYLFNQFYVLITYAKEQKNKELLKMLVQWQINIRRLSKVKGFSEDVVKEMLPFGTDISLFNLVPEKKEQLRKNKNYVIQK